MNKIYKVIYSKARHCSVVVSELTRSHTKPVSIAGTSKKTLSAMVLSAILMTSAASALAANTPENVVYDSDGKTITLKNTDGNGTKITNVANGELAAASKDAVNGSQLYQTNLQITDLADALNKNNSTIAQAQTDITRIKTQNITFKSDINTLKTQVSTGWVATIDGARVKTVAPTDNNLNFTAGDDVSITDPGNGSIKIGVTPTGKVESGNTHVVSGGTVYSAIDTEKQAREAADTALTNKIGTVTDGNYVKASDSLGSNIGTLDTQVKSNADAITKEIQDRSDAITNVTNTINALSGNTVQYDDETKGKVTLGGGDNGTTIGNVKAGTLSADSKEAVNGSQLFTTNSNLTQEITDRTTADEAEKTARENADNDIKNNIIGTVADGTYVKASGTIADNLGKLDAGVKANADSITDVRDDVIGTITDGTYVKAADNVAGNLGKLDAGVKANADAIAQEVTDRTNEITKAKDELSTKISTLDGNAVKYDDADKGTITLAGAEGTTITHVKAGTLSAESTDAVNGSQLFDTNTKLAQEVQDRKDAITKEVSDRDEAIGVAKKEITDKIGTIDANGSYITVDGTISSNLTALDTQVKNNQSAIEKEVQDRTDAISGVESKINTLAGNAVQYDSSTKDLVTFSGTKGTRLTNLRDATLSATSTDAVTGRQLYQTNQNISGFSKQITQNADALKGLSTSVSNSLSSVSAMSESISAIDNTKADASLTNLSDAGRNVINEAATEAVQKYMKSLNGNAKSGTKTISTQMAATLSPISFATNTTENVVYDSDGKTITLENTDGTGTKITNVANGELAAASKDAVNGSQLYQTNLQITDLADALNKNNSTIAQAQTDITRMKTQNITFKSDINTLKTQVSTGWVATIDGTRVKTVAPTDNNLNFTAGDDVSITDPGNGSIKISIKAAGKVESGNTHVVTGNDVYQAIKDMPTVGTLAGKANTGLDNINDSGKSVISDIAKKALSSDMDKKANVDASNIDANAYTKKLGTGKAEQGSTGLVTGDTLYNAVKDKADKSYVDEGLSKKADKDSVYTKDETYSRTEIDNKVTGITQDLSKKADTDLSNLTDSGKSVISDIAKGSVKVISGKNTTVTEGTDGTSKTYTVNVDDSAIQNAIQPKLDEKADKNLSNLTDKGKDVIKDTMKADMDKKANVDASNITGDAVTAWQKVLGTGDISENSTGLVTGQTVYQAIKDMPTGDSLMKYDSATKTITVAADKDATTVDFSGKDSDGNTINRTITGITTDENDATSAANVGYVQDVAGNLANGVQRVANELSHDINKVGAGAAALASLHPGEFDPENKLDFSAGYGHYKGANAGALGAYYHPNEDTIISLAGTMGNGDPMLSAGVTFKLGPSGAKTMSRTALTKQVAADQKIINAMANKMAQMEQQMNRVLALVDVSKVKEMPDVPQGHWAKDAVDHLAGNGIVQGYTDGKFHGDKPMTRYEYAQMLYTALKQGKIVGQDQLNEYAPELAQLKAAEKNK